MNAVCTTTQDWCQSLAFPRFWRIHFFLCPEDETASQQGDRQKFLEAEWSWMWGEARSLSFSCPVPSSLGYLLPIFCF